MWPFLIGIVVTLAGLAAWRYRPQPRSRTAAKQSATDGTGQQLAELAKLTGELAHEIKNPLTTLKINLTLVQEQLGDLRQPPIEVERALRKLAIIQQEADRLDKLLTGFLTFVRQPDLQLSALDLNTVVGEIVDFYAPQSIQHNIRLRPGLSTDPLPVRIDIGMFKQVLLNVMINAQQAMPQGGELMVGTRREGDHVIVNISDTGIGIPAHQQEKVFAPYFSGRPKGTGLGLATAKKIVDALHGRIWVDSEVDKGTSFSIQLPLSPTNAIEEH